MSYTHVIVKVKSEAKKKPATLIETDLDEQFVVEHIIKPYVQGTIIFVDGSRAEHDNIDKITVYSSEATIQEILEEKSKNVQKVTARERANRIISGEINTSPVLLALKSEGAKEITRKMFNEAQGIS